MYMVHFQTASSCTLLGPCRLSQVFRAKFCQGNPHKVGGELNSRGAIEKKDILFKVVTITGLVFSHCNCLCFLEYALGDSGSPSLNGFMEPKCLRAG